MPANRPIPGPPRSPSTLFQFRRDPIGYLRNLAQRYGDVSGFNVGGQELVLLNHPDMIRDVLVTHARRFVKGRGLERAKILLGEGLLTSEGDFHLRQRRMMQPAFHRQQISEYGRTMADIAGRAADRWKSGDVLDVAEAAAGITLTIVGKTLFDADLEHETEQVGSALTDTLQLFNVLSLPLAKLLIKLPLPAVRKFRQGRERLDNTVYRMIDERRDAGDGGDLLSMLLAARDDEEDGARMTDLQVRDEAMTIFLAGHETTANAIAWTLYLLAEHPDVEAKLVEELGAVLAGRLPSVDDLPNLRYTRQVVNESLRLYPPAWIIGRRAIEDHGVGDYVIRKGTVAILAQVVMHVDRRYWSDPFHFDPDRWSVEDTERPKFAYFPFGGGPRVCIGEQFAWMEAILVLATLLQRRRFRLIPGQKIVPKPIITLRPKYGIKMVIEKRG